MMHSDNVFREGYSRLDVAVLWTFLTLGFHGIAAVVAAYLRERKLSHGTWTNRPLQKAGISFVGATFGYIFLLTYIAVSRGLIPVELLRALIWVPLPFITAYCTLEFFGIQFGNNRLENALRSGLDGVIQGGVTALFCVFVTEAWMEISPIAAKAPAGDALEWTKFVILNVFVLGLSLGILLPAAYRRAGQLVDEETVKSRRDRLEQLAAKVLTNQTERDKWLKTPLKELDGVSPFTAATSFYLFNRGATAMSLIIGYFPGAPRG
jgi:hypothetical protein